MTEIKEVSITTEHGTFVGPNMRAVKKMAAAAAEKEKAEHAARVARIELAMERARGNGFRIMRAKYHAGSGKLGVFDYVPVGHRAFKSLLTLDTEETHERGARRCTIHAADGSPVYNFGHPVVGCVMGGNGYPIAVVTRSEDENHLVSVHALGYCAEVVQCEVVPGVTAEDFNWMPEE